MITSSLGCNHCEHNPVDAMNIPVLAYISYKRSYLSMLKDVGQQIMFMCT